MSGFARHLIIAGAISLTLLTAFGCARRERREIRVEQETHEGEVHEKKPGEMIVE